MNFSFDNVEASQSALKNLKNQILNLKAENKDISEKYLNEFKESLENDLNTAEALATLWKMLKDESLSDSEKYNTAMRMDEVFSLDLNKKDEVVVTPEIQELLDRREQYRKEKNWAEADAIRDQLKNLGYEVKDK
jgi:cysteinyl-tRNA synthetase